MQNNLISILIPTYNRADFLDYSLEIHTPIFKTYHIQILIFDNGSTDNTQEVVKKWIQKYPYITYFRHEENIGGVGNFEYALQNASTEYIWMIGDTYQISCLIIDKVLNILHDRMEKTDAIVLNLEKKISLNSAIYNDSNILLHELGALMTCIAVSIFRKDMLNEEVLIRYRDLWFTHMAVIFESIASKSFNIHWMQEFSITTIKHPNLSKTNWSQTQKLFDIGCESWTNFVMSLPPSYKLENKMKCIMDFGKVSGIFRLKNLFLLRSLDILNLNSLNKYKKILPLTIDLPQFILYGLALMPKRIIKFFIFIYVSIFNKSMKQKYLLLFGASK